MNKIHSGEWKEAEQACDPRALTSFLSLGRERSHSQGGNGGWMDPYPY